MSTNVNESHPSHTGGRDGCGWIEALAAACSSIGVASREVELEEPPVKRLRARSIAAR